jgi:hypothetical protein
LIDRGENMEQDVLERFAVVTLIAALLKFGGGFYLGAKAIRIRLLATILFVVIVTWLGICFVWDITLPVVIPFAEVAIFLPVQALALLLGNIFGYRHFLEIEEMKTKSVAELYP